MGEFAQRRSDGARIKIGTCENMYYLRAHDVVNLDVDPDGGMQFTPDVLDVIRFRFPFPNEDHIQPGDYEGVRSIPVFGLQFPVDPTGSDGHDSVQFTARNGYLLSLPCPEVTLASGEDFPVGRLALNGYGGSTKIAWQAWRDGRLVTICECGGCGALWRIDTLEDAAPLLAALEAEAQHRPDSATFWRTIAERVVAGYEATPYHVAAVAAGVGAL